MSDSIWSHYHHMERSISMRHVTWPITVGEMINIFAIPDPNLSIHFVTFRALRGRVSNVIGEKLCFPIAKATKFTVHVQYHVTCAYGVPQNHMWQFFYPELSIHYTTYTTTIKGSFILEHPHVIAVFGRKKTKSSQNRSTKWRLFGTLRV